MIDRSELLHHVSDCIASAVENGYAHILEWPAGDIADDLVQCTGGFEKYSKHDIVWCVKRYLSSLGV